MADGLLSRCRRCRRRFMWVEEVVPVDVEPRPAPAVEFALPAGEAARRWVQVGELAHAQHTCAWEPRVNEPVEVPSWTPAQIRRSEEFERWYRRDRRGEAE